MAGPIDLVYLLHTTRAKMHQVRMHYAILTDTLKAAGRLQSLAEINSTKSLRTLGAFVLHKEDNISKCFSGAVFNTMLYLFAGD